MQVWGASQNQNRSNYSNQSEQTLISQGKKVSTQGENKQTRCGKENDSAGYDKLQFAADRLLGRRRLKT